jgi:hypothetical protein
MRTRFSIRSLRSTQPIVDPEPDAAHWPFRSRPTRAYTRGIDTLAAAIEALKQPLSQEERGYGWTERSQELWIAYLDGLTQGIRVATYPDRAAVLNQLAGWLDQDGIDRRSPLAEKLGEAQAQLRERFATSRY